MTFSMDTDDVLVGQSRQAMKAAKIDGTLDAIIKRYQLQFEMEP